MTAKQIARLLEQTLLHGGAMQYGLYEYELAEPVNELTAKQPQAGELPINGVQTIGQF